VLEPETVYDPQRMSSAAPKTVPAAKAIVTLAARTAQQLDRLDDARRRLLRGLKPTPRDPELTGPLAGLKLTPRQRQILNCLLRGDSEKQIALKLHISPQTVRTYIKKLHKSLGVRSGGELLARFVSP